MDNRNYDITNRIFEVLDNVKGFDVDKLKVYELIPTECTERQ